MQDQISPTNYLTQVDDLNKREKLIYDTLCRFKKATSWQLLEHFGWNNPNKVRPRMTDLFKKGLVKKIQQVNVGGISQWVWGVV